MAEQTKILQVTAAQIDKALVAIAGQRTAGRFMQSDGQGGVAFTDGSGGLMVTFTRVSTSGAPIKLQADKPYAEGKEAIKAGIPVFATVKPDSSNNFTLIGLAERYDAFLRFVLIDPSAKKAWHISWSESNAGLWELPLSSGGGSGGVTQDYVDQGDAETLQAANRYTDQHSGAGALMVTFTRGESVDGVTPVTADTPFATVTGPNHHLFIASRKRGPDVYFKRFTDRNDGIEQIIFAGDEKGKFTTIPFPSGGSGGSITVDAAMSATSTNPVQNKVVKKYIDDLMGKANTLMGEW